MRIAQRIERNGVLERKGGRKGAKKWNRSQWVLRVVRLLVVCKLVVGVAVLGGSGCGSDDKNKDPVDGGFPDGDNGDGQTPDGTVDGDGQTLDGTVDGGEDQAPARSCATVFRFTPQQAVGTVELAGEWDWQNPEPMQPDGNGGYVLEKTLDSGIWAYKFIVDGNWILDPQNAYRKYHDGIENSGMRVADCTIPLLELVEFAADGTAATTSARVAFYRSGDGGGGGAAVDPDSVAVTLVSDFTESAVPFDYVDHGIEVAVADLEPGKHTLRFEAADLDGRAAEPVEVPFWIEAEAFDWRDAIIYMVMLDRFRDGNAANTPPATGGADPTADWQGGDLAGVTAAIEEGYFDALGVRALWLSPFVRNPEGSYDEHGHGVTGYHGYWPIRGREIDARFGTEDELEALVSAAHAHGIRVLMDFVLNHVHEGHEYFLDHPGWFRTGCQCGEPGCDWTSHRLDCLFQPYLPDVNWEITEASETIIADALWWLRRFDLDGLRVDAVKHVEDLAVFNLSTRVGEAFELGGVEYFLLGETAMGWAGPDINDNLSEYAMISRYIGPNGLNGQFDFVLYHAVSYNVWAHDTYGLIHADYWTQASLDHYPEYAVMTPYIGSHDTQRFISLADPNASSVVYNKWPSDGLPVQPTTAEPYGRTAVGLAWVLSLPGAPLLYYGDEYGEYGGSDPDNRHLWRAAGERSTAENELFDFVSRVGTARRDSVALRRGDYASLLGEEGFLCFARYTADDLALVVLNHSDSEQTRQIDLPAYLPQPAATLQDALRPADPPLAIANDAVTVSVPARSAVILLP